MTQPSLLVKFQYLDVATGIGIIEVGGVIYNFALGQTLNVQAVPDDAELGYGNPVSPNLAKLARDDAQKITGTVGKFALRIFDLIIHAEDGRVTAKEAWESIVKDLDIIIENNESNWYKDRILFYRAWWRALTILGSYAKERSH